MQNLCYNFKIGFCNAEIEAKKKVEILESGNLKSQPCQKIIKELIMPQNNQEVNKKQIKVDERTRIWSFIAYPDSVPENWEQILTEQFNLKWARSPLHDSDLNADDTQKKPHWHIVLIFDGKKSYNQIKTISDTINATIPQKVHNLQGLMRYFIHLDNPEKAQYDIKDIKAVGIDVELELYGEREARLKVINDMRVFCEANDIREFCELFNYAAENEPRWFEALSYNSAMVMNMYLKSRRHKLEYSTSSR